MSVKCHDQNLPNIKVNILVKSWSSDWYSCARTTVLKVIFLQGTHNKSCVSNSKDCTRVRKDNFYYVIHGFAFHEIVLNMPGVNIKAMVYFRKSSSSSLQCKIRQEWHLTCANIPKWNCDKIKFSVQVGLQCSETKEESQIGTCHLAPERIIVWIDEYYLFKQLFSSCQTLYPFENALLSKDLSRRSPSKRFI